MSIKFVLLASARSGSSYLTTAFQNHPDICMHGEIFHEDVQTHIREEALRKLDLDKRIDNPIEFIKDVYEENEGKAAIGFKIWRSQSPEGCDYLIESPWVKKIVLERRNALAGYSSDGLAKKTGIWNRTQGQSAGSEVKSSLKLSFNEKAFLQYVDWHENYVYGYYKQKLSENNQDYLCLDYQAHIMKSQIDVVLEFLDLPKYGSFLGNKEKLNGNNILERFEEKDHPKIIQCLTSIHRLEWLIEDAE